MTEVVGKVSAEQSQAGGIAKSVTSKVPLRSETFRFLN